MLRQFIDVEIVCQNKTIVKGLSELFEEYEKSGKTQKITIALKKGESASLVIRYCMPEEVGDEAQGATSKFNLVYSTAFAQ